MSSNQHIQYRAPPLPRPQYLQSDQQQQGASYQQQSASTSSSSYPSNQSQAYPQWQQHFPSNSFPSSNNSPETLDEDPQESKPVVKKGGRTSAANSASATGKRKERIHYSCTECHRRKQKCDRQQPCGHCVARNVPDLCKTFRPGDDTTDVSARMKRLESLMDDGFRQLADRLDSITSQVAYQSQVQAENLSLHHHHQQQQQQYHHHMNGNRGEGSSSGISRIPIDPPTGWGMGSHRRRSNGATGEGGGGDEINGDSDSENGVANDRLSPETGAFIGSASVGIKSVQTRMGLLNELPITVSNIYDPVKTQLPPSIDDAMREFGSNGPSSLLLDDLPSKESIQILLDHFFGEINWIRQPLPENSLRHSFEVMLKSDPILTPQSVNLYGMMMAIFSISALSVDSNADPSIFPDGPRSRRSRARKWHTSSRRALFVSSVLGCNQLEHVVCLNLACRFLLLDKRICESWTLAASAVKASHAIGLHREPKCLGLGEKESELRRRVWSSIYFGDRVLCATLGRPTSIDDAVCDTLPPNDIDEESDAPPPSEHILSKFPPGTKPPTVWSHTTQRHHLAVLMGKIIAVFQNVHRHAHYSEILQIDKEICDFRSSLPSHFRSNLNASGDGIEESDKELDEAFPFLETHRFLIETEINFLRTTLHRPYLLRSSQGSRYLPSRAACIEAAHHDIVLRVSFVKCLKAKFAPKEVSLAYQVQIGHSKWFSSLLICGIALVLDPHSDQFPILKNHLQHYFDTVGLKLQKLRAEGEHLKDEMRERETNILKLFMKKADELAAQEPSSNNAATTNTTTSTASDQTNGKGKKRENQGEDGRIIKRGRPAKKGSHSSGPEDEGDHATAGLLLGLQQQASSPLSQPPHRHSVSSSSNNSITSPMISRSGLTEQSPASTNPSGSAEHAQDLFDAWYKAEFAAGGSVSDTFGHVEGMNGGNGLNAWLTQPQMIQTSTNTSLNPPFFGGQANNTSTSNNFAFSNGAFGGQNSLDYSTQNLVNENESNMFNSAFNNRAVPFENMNLQALQQQQQRQQPDYSPVIEQQTNDNSDGGEFWKTLIEKITN